MTKPSVSDFQGCSWKGIDLSRFVTDWKDSRQSGLAVHRYFGRDGGEIERIARKAHEAKVTLAFAGPSWRKDWLPIAASIDEDPAGLLVHPAYGQMQAVCQGFDAASMNIETASNLYIVPLSFVEDSIDTRLAATDRSAAAARATIEATGNAILQRTSRQSPAFASITRLLAITRLAATASTQEYLSAGRYLGNACLCDRGVVAGGG